MGVALSRLFLRPGAPPIDALRQADVSSEYVPAANTTESAMRLKPHLPSLLCALSLVLCLALAAAPARAESAAAARLRALAEQMAADQNATSAEQAATRGLFSTLAADENSEATGKAALALSEIALGRGNADSAKNLAEAVLDLAAGSKSGKWATLAGHAKDILGAATSVQAAYAAGPDVRAVGTLPFVDADAFDRKLSDSLGAKPASLELTFPVAVRMKNLPERLDKWLSAIEKSGGAVGTVAVAEERGILGELFDLALKLYDLLSARDLYAPAQHYNATVHYGTPSGTLRKVVFTLRPGQ